MSHNLKKHIPTIYNGIQEIEQISNTEQKEIDNLYSEMKLAYNRQTVINADEFGVRLYENLLDINSDDSINDLDTRKERIIVQLTTAPPFSFNFLLKQLDRMVGYGNYKSWIDFNNYTLYIQSELSNKTWFNELTYLLAKIKPSNILYIYIGYGKSNIGVRSSTKYYTAGWKYKLNGTWKLGQYPFYISNQGQWLYKLNGTWKLGKFPFFDRGEGIELGLNNIKDYFKNNLAKHAKDIITSIVVNDEFTFSSDDFLLFSVNGNKLEIEFSYTSQEHSNEITNIKIKNNNNLLVEKNLYILVDESVTVHLDIDILEVLK